MSVIQGDNASVLGVPIKYLSLMVLVVQNSALVLSMRYSRVIPGPRYLTSTAVILSEVIKCTVSLVIHLCQKRWDARDENLPLFAEEGHVQPTYGMLQLLDDAFGRKSGYVMLLVPAALYTLQNNLQFIAASNLDAATFQVAYQCKILTTAIFAVTLLRQSLSLRKWTSLVVLTAGVALVQFPSSVPEEAAGPQSGNWFLGMSAVAVACLCSGFAGVYFEKILKGSSASLWLRNVQLGSASMVIAVFGALVWDGPAIKGKGFFQGYNWVVITTVLIQAMGGLIVAIVVKHANNILKGFATSISIILSIVASTFLFGFIITPLFVAGAALVLFATYLYSLPDQARQQVTESSESLLSDADDFNEKVNLDDIAERPSYIQRE